jgi:hypothetical protein
MANVNALPFMLGIIGGVLLFVAWLPLGIRESRRPYRWPEARPPKARRVAPQLRVVEPSAKVEPRVVTPRSAPRLAPRFAPRHGHAGAARVAIVVAAFTAWSLWSLRGRVDQR